MRNQITCPPGTKVRKLSGKPFKSGSKTATVTGTVVHPVNPLWLAYTFAEDVSVVRTTMCISVDDPYKQENHS